MNWTFILSSSFLPIIIKKSFAQILHKDSEILNDKGISELFKSPPGTSKGSDRISLKRFCFFENTLEKDRKWTVSTQGKVSRRRLLAVITLSRADFWATHISLVFIYHLFLFYHGNSVLRKAGFTMNIHNWFFIFPCIKDRQI